MSLLMKDGGGSSRLVKPGQIYTQSEEPSASRRSVELIKQSVWVTVSSVCPPPRSGCRLLLMFSS